MKDYPPPPKKKKKKKKIGSLPAPRSGYATTIIVGLFVHLLILEYPDHHQNLISSSLYYPGPRPKISSQSVYNFLSNVVHKQTNKQTNRQTNATKNITRWHLGLHTLGSGTQYCTVLSFVMHFSDMHHVFPPLASSLLFAGQRQLHGMWSSFDTWLAVENNPYPWTPSGVLQ